MLQNINVYTASSNSDSSETAYTLRNMIRHQDITQPFAHRLSKQVVCNSMSAEGNIAGGRAFPLISVPSRGGNPNTRGLSLARSLAIFISVSGRVPGHSR